MKKRLRKKYHLGEYQELCFDVCYRYKGDVFSEEEDAFWNEFISDCIVGNGLNCGGSVSMDGTCEYAAYSVDKSQQIENQLAAVQAWLAAREDVELVRCGEYRDLWYDFPVSMTAEMKKLPLSYYVALVRARRLMDC
jgi:uncharacterized protein YggL (DUF469 family)